jgi:energy-coupling factor transporter ATP-binding protein EcfA2
VTALTGPTGSGETTLLRTFNRTNGNVSACRRDGDDRQEDPAKRCGADGHQGVGQLDRIRRQHADLRLDGPHTAGDAGGLRQAIGRVIVAYSRRNTE